MQSLPTLNKVLPRSINKHQRKSCFPALAQHLAFKHTAQLESQISLLSHRLKHLVSPVTRPHQQIDTLRTFTIIIMLLPAILFLFTATAHGSNTSTSATFPHTFASNTSTSSAIQPHAFASNTTVYALLVAPIYRNVTAGDAWVFPSSANDLGARSMACECFSPDGGFLNVSLMAKEVVLVLM